MTVPDQYTPDLEARIRAWAESQVTPKRLTHVRGVVDTCGALARRYAPNEVTRARVAGWLHDAAKAWPDDRLLAYAEAHGLPVSEGERRVPMLLHGLVGYALADAEFGLHDPALARACALHTTGGPGMTALDKILFVADLIEPGRDFPGVDALRAEAERDLDRAVLRAADQTLRHLLNRQRYIDPRAIALWNELVSAGVRYDS